MSFIKRSFSWSRRSFSVGRLVVTLLLSCSVSVWAAGGDQVSDSLQQQLQLLQESLNTAPSKEAQKAAGTTTTTTTTTTTAPVAPVASNNAPIAAPVPTPAPITNTPPSSLDSPVDDMGNADAQQQPASLVAEKAAAAELVDDDIEGTGLRAQAFGKVLTNTLPLSPAQIRMLRNMYDATQKAASSYPGVPPRPTASSLVVNLSPGATPPVVRLGAGFITSLVFVDSTGAPWPIDSYSLGNPTAFNIQWDKKSNILLVQAITAHRIGNLAVLLKGLNTPVMLDLNPGQAALDVRVDLRIPGLGPHAKPTVHTLPGTESPALLALLDGIPPPGAQSLKSSVCENCAWLVDNKLYLRTRFVVLSPAWISTLSSADGTHVYEMQPTPLVLATYNGKTIKMRIEGF